MDADETHDGHAHVWPRFNGIDKKNCKLKTAQSRCTFSTKFKLTLAAKMQNFVYSCQPYSQIA